jgi:hypothetical protein
MCKIGEFVVIVGTILAIVLPLRWLLCKAYGVKFWD